MFPSGFPLSMVYYLIEVSPDRCVFLFVFVTVRLLSGRDLKIVSAMSGHFCCRLKRDPKQTEPARPSLVCFVHPVKT